MAKRFLTKKLSPHGHFFRTPNEIRTKFDKNRLFVSDK